MKYLQIIIQISKKINTGSRTGCIVFRFSYKVYKTSLFKTFWSANITLTSRCSQLHDNSNMEQPSVFSVDIPSRPVMTLLLKDQSLLHVQSLCSAGHTRSRRHPGSSRLLPPQSWRRLRAQPFTAAENNLHDLV